jgi:hypothetical protein
LSYRTAARLLAEDFANYAHFSPTPYGVNEAVAYGYWRDRVLLFSKPIGDERMRCFGAVGMRWQKNEYNDAPDREGWWMTWAWFHPTEQRKGHLENAWPHISKMFPDFMPLPPATPAMGNFLKKIKFNHPFLGNREFPVVTSSI